MKKFLDEAGLSYFWEKIKEYFGAKTILRVPITLLASGWSDNSYTISVPGVLADETAQLIDAIPYVSSQAAYFDAGIVCSNQAKDSLTFICDTVPTSDINIHVTIQSLTTPNILRVPITLLSSGWVDGSYTISVPGVSSDEASQLIHAVPYISDQTAYIDAGLLCTGQAENSLTFTCIAAPSSDIHLHVIIQALTDS